MTQHRGNYAKVNGLRLCHEIHGTGEPLILLHGGVGAIEMDPGCPVLGSPSWPAAPHYYIFSSPTLASTVTPFLDAPMPEAG